MGEAKEVLTLQNVRDHDKEILLIYIYAYLVIFNFLPNVSIVTT